MFERSLVCTKQGQWSDVVGIAGSKPSVMLWSIVSLTHLELRPLTTKALIWHYACDFQREGRLVGARSLR